MCDAFATPNELIERYDAMLIGDLCSDKREPLSRSQVECHPNVMACLRDASGEIVTALIAGGRYTESQLHALEGITRNNLVRITCDIAMSMLVGRRLDKRFAELAESTAKTARTHIVALKQGDNIFGIPEMQSSGTMEIAVMSSIQLDDLNTLPTRMPGFFPTNSTRVIRGY